MMMRFPQNNITLPCRLTLLIAILSLFSAVSVCAQTPEDLFKEGNALYDRGEFDSATICYERILSEGLVSPYLYYNLANAYFRQKEYARAILNYERALKENPSFKDARFNLELARTYTVDRINPPQEAEFVKFFKTIYLWFSPLVWGLIAIGFLIAGFVIFLTLKSWYQPGYRFRPGRFFTAIGCCCIAFLAIWAGATGQRHMWFSDEAIILQSVVSVKSSPDAQSKDLFLLHSGTKVKVIERVGPWYEVAIPDGHRGWVEKETLEDI